MKPAPGLLFSLIALLLPVAGAIYAWNQNQRPADPMGSAIGVILGAYLLLAIVALVRGERPLWLSITSATLNLQAAAAPVIYFYSRK